MTETTVTKGSAALAAMGWGPDWIEAFEPWRRRGAEPARMIVAAGRYGRALTALDEIDVRVRGRLLHGAPDRAPVVGDWVALRREPDRTGVVEGVLPRRTLIARRAAGRAAGVQPLAANVDVALVVMGLDEDANLRRLDRMVALVREAGAEVRVVLNKADLAADLEIWRERVAERSGSPVSVVAARDGIGIEALRAALPPGCTTVLVGSSGVGKSTILNRLLGTERQRTGPVREGDGRGRHTTTLRELVPLPGGIWVIDTPGLREVGVVGGEALGAAETALSAYAGRCRFRDCRHRDEPGCAVREAVERGELDSEHLDHLVALAAEAEALERRLDDRKGRDGKRADRAIARAQRKYRPRWL